MPNILFEMESAKEMLGDDPLIHEFHLSRAAYDVFIKDHYGKRPDGEVTYQGMRVRAQALQEQRVLIHHKHT